MALQYETGHREPSRVRGVPLNAQAIVLQRGPAEAGDHCSHRPEKRGCKELKLFAEKALAAKPNTAVQESMPLKRRCQDGPPDRDNAYDGASTKFQRLSPATTQQRHDKQDEADHHLVFSFEQHTSLKQHSTMSSHTQEIMARMMTGVPLDTTMNDEAVSFRDDRRSQEIMARMMTGVPLDTTMNDEAVSFRNEKCELTIERTWYQAVDPQQRRPRYDVSFFLAELRSLIISVYHRNILTVQLDRRRSTERSRCQTDDRDPAGADAAS
ncbi:MAG: hypothetical protein M1828_005719 [Chrysothrix sp. TS-e1954]|nr:MAG: hypothetical protein M1828_005719 [Chrysothrix sp. TS-e1954]